MAFDYEYSPSRDRGSCSTIIVGKDASATGYVLVAHNEDDYDCVIQVHKVPRIRHKPGETIRFADAKGVIPQVEGPMPISGRTSAVRAASPLRTAL